MDMVLIIYTETVDVYGDLKLYGCINVCIELQTRMLVLV